MPNWCYTTINIAHDNDNKLRGLYDNIVEWLHNSVTENDFDKFNEGWLGNVVVNAGFCKVENVERNSPYPCRGAVSDIDYSPHQITIHTETAWCPMNDLWYAVIDKYLPDAEFIYSAEESGCEIYNTNDPDLIGRYVLDDSERDVYEYDASREKVIKHLQKITKSDSESIGKLIELAEERFPDDYIGVHEWNYVND